MKNILTIIVVSLLLSGGASAGKYEMEQAAKTIPGVADAAFKEAPHFGWWYLIPMQVMITIIMVLCFAMGDKKTMGLQKATQLLSGMPIRKNQSKNLDVINLWH